MCPSFQSVHLEIKSSCPLLTPTFQISCRTTEPHLDDLDCPRGHLVRCRLWRSFTDDFVLDVFGDFLHMRQRDLGVVAQHQSNVGIWCFASIFQVDVGKIQGLLQREAPQWR